MEANEESAKELPELNAEVAEKTNNEALAAALRRLQDRAQKVHNSHYTKHGSHSVKHSSW